MLLSHIKYCWIYFIININSYTLLEIKINHLLFKLSIHKIPLSIWNKLFTLLSTPLKA